jgi:hypothetical protein
MLAICATLYDEMDVTTAFVPVLPVSRLAPNRPLLAGGDQTASARSFDHVPLCEDHANF